jgi:hypothetical protein
VQLSDGPFDLGPLRHFASDPVTSLNRATAELFGVFVIALAWIRGSLIGLRPQITHRSVLASLTVGLVIVVIGLSVGRAAVASSAIDDAALPFFVCGLFALALIQLSQSEHIQGDTWHGPWLMALLATIGGLALIGAIAGLLPLDTINRVLSPVGDLLVTIIDVLLYLLVLPIVIVFNWFLTRLLAGRLHPLDMRFQAFEQATRQPLHPSHPNGLMMFLAHLGNLLVIVLLVGIAVLALVWVFRRLEREDEVERGDRERVESRVSLGTDLSDLLNGMLNRFRRGPHNAAPALSPRLLELRKLYLAMLSRAERHNLRRPEGATPLEFIPVLEQQFDSDLPARLSAEFSAGRYGRVEPSDQELEEMRTAERSLR